MLKKSFLLLVTHFSRTLSSLHFYGVYKTNYFNVPFLLRTEGCQYYRGTVRCISLRLASLAKLPSKDNSNGNTNHRNIFVLPCPGVLMPILIRGVDGPERRKQHLANHKAKDNQGWYKCSSRRSFWIVLPPMHYRDPTVH